MEVKKEILVDNRLFEFEKAYPSFVLYHMKDFKNIKTCILWVDIYSENYKQDIIGKENGMQNGKEITR